MDDSMIIELYIKRDESAITESSNKYGNYLKRIALGILKSSMDAEEILNDTLTRAWGVIPPQRPTYLSAFLGKIARNLSLNRLEMFSAEKRGGDKVTSLSDELSSVFPSENNVEQEVSLNELTELINKFLSEQVPLTRKIFVKRYWYMLEIKEISRELDISESKVKVTLMRTRNALKDFLVKEEYFV